MRKTMRMPQKMALIGLIVLGGAFGAPAFADCAASLKSVEAEASEASDAAKKASAEKHIAEAKLALSVGNEEECADHADLAHSLLTGAPLRPKTITVE